MAVRGWMALLLLCYAVIGGAEERAVSDPFQVTIGETPVWVEPARLATGPRGEEGGSVRYLLSDSQTLIGEHAEKATHYRRIVSQPLNESGLEEVAEIKVDFNPIYQQLTLHGVTLWRDGKALQRLEAEKIKLIQREEDMERRLYDGVVTAMVILEDVRVGDRVDYSYSIRGRNPVFGDHYFSTMGLGWSVAVERVRVRVVAPVERPLQTRVFNTDIEPQRLRHGQQLELLWDREGVAAISDEGDYPGWYDPYPRLEVSEYGSWGEVAQWAETLYRLDGGLDGELRARLEEWRGSGDRMAAAGAAMRFVQDEIRYFGVELGQNSHRPNRPEEVFRKRYGDCKDKALLLQALLRGLGIDAWPALVSTDYRQGVAGMLPSPGIFDHVILLAEIDGKHYWLDATRNHQRGPFPQLGSSHYGKALLVGAEGRALVDVDTTDMGVSSVDVEEHFVIRDYTAPVEMTVTTAYSAGMAESQRRTYANNDLKKIGRHYLNFYARRYAEIESGGELEMVDDEVNNRITVVEHYLIPDFWEHEEGRLNGELVANTIGQYLELPRVVQRKMPLALSHPLKVVHRSVVEYPEDIAFNARQREEKIVAKEMYYRRQIDYTARKLTVLHEYESRDDAVLPEQVPEHIRQVKRIRDNLYYAFWVDDGTKEKPGKQPEMELVQELLRRLARPASER